MYNLKYNYSFGSLLYLHNIILFLLNSIRYVTFTNLFICYSFTTQVTSTTKIGNKHAYYSLHSGYCHTGNSSH